MRTQNSIRMLAAAIVLAGGTYLSTTPAYAVPGDEEYPCTDQGWSDAIHDAGAVCGGSTNPTLVAGCSGGHLAIEQILCT